MKPILQLTESTPRILNSGFHLSLQCSTCPETESSFLVPDETRPFQKKKFVLGWFPFFLSSPCCCCKVVWREQKNAVSCAFGCRLLMCQGMWSRHAIQSTRVWPNFNSLEDISKYAKSHFRIQTKNPHIKSWKENFGLSIASLMRRSFFKWL